MKLLIWGIGGRLGKTLLEDARKKDYITDIAGFDKFAKKTDFSNINIFNSINEINDSFDVIIDFSKPDAINDLLPYAIKTKTPIVIATTGHSEDQLKMIKDTSKQIPIFKTTNMSLGVNLLIELVKKACEVLGESYDIEIIEQHHNIKVDSPSGTAATIAEEINKVYNNSKNFVYGRHSANEKRNINDIGIHSVRGGSVIGKHEVLFLGNDEFITLKHEAQSKSIFTEGALKASQFLITKKNGFYSMSDLLNDILK